MIATAISLALSNFTITCLLLGLLASGISLLGKAKPLRPGAVVKSLLAYFLFFSIGLANLYNFVLHVFFGAMTARFIGWEQSPFQAEVGFASLGFSVVGFMAFRGSFGLKLAAVVAPACFLLGAAAGHAYQMISSDNFAPGNAGTIFYTDILIPILGLTLLGWEGRLTSSGVFDNPADTA